MTYADDAESIGARVTDPPDEERRSRLAVSEQIVDFRRLVRTVYHHRLLVVACALVGIAVGLLIASRQPPTYVARSVVLLPPSGVDARGNLLRNMLTEMQIATSGELLDQVGASLTPPLPTSELRQRVTAQAISNELLQVEARGASGREAVILADGVASAYVEYSNGVTSANSSAEIEGLVERASELDGRIQQLESEIVSTTAGLAALGFGGGSTPQGLRLSALLDALRLDQADAARQLSNINNRIAEARLDAELRRRGTRLLQEAVRPAGPSSPKPLHNAALGGLTGGVLGTLVVTTRQLGRRRLVRRDDIADVVGAPVLASVTVPQVRGVEGYRTFLETWSPDVVETWALRQAVLRLGLTQERLPASVVMITLSGDRAAVAAAAQLAIFTAAAEMRTELVIASSHPTASDLRRACHVVAARRPLRPHLSVLTALEDEEAMQAVEVAEVTIRLVVAEADGAPLPPRDGLTFTTLIVSSGFAGADLLASTALRCADAGRPILGVFVVNPDPGDPTTGRLEMVEPISPDARWPPVEQREVRTPATDLPVR